MPLLPRCYLLSFPLSLSLSLSPFSSPPPSCRSPRSFSLRRSSRRLRRPSPYSSHHSLPTERRIHLCHHSRRVPDTRTHHLLSLSLSLTRRRNAISRSSLGPLRFGLLNGAVNRCFLLSLDSTLESAPPPITRGLIDSKRERLHNRLLHS